MRRWLLVAVLGLLGLAATLGVSPTHAQPEVDLRIDQVVNLFPDVRLLVTLTDAQGRTIPGARQEDFTLREEGHSLPVTVAETLDPRDTPVHLVIAVDKSCYIQPALDQVKGAAGDLLGRLADPDHVAIVLMGSQPQILEPASIEDAKAEIANLSAESLDHYQALDNGAFESIRLAARGPGGHRAVVMFTDGRDSQSPDIVGLPLGDALQLAALLRVPISVVGIGTERDDQGLRLLASDGKPAELDQPDQVDALLTGIIAGMRRSYWVSYRSQRPADGGRYAADLSVNLTNRGATTASVPLQAPLPPTSTPTRVSTRTPTPAPAPPTATQTTVEPITPGSGKAALIVGGPLLIVLLLAAAGAVFALLLRSSGPQAQPLPVGPGGPPAWPLTPAVAGAPGRATQAEPRGAALVVERGRASQAVLRLPTDRPVLIGRSPDADLVLDDRTVEPHHARIRFSEGGFTIRDLSGRGELRVNGRPVESMILRLGDRIEIGVAVLRLDATI